MGVISGTKQTRTLLLVEDDPAQAELTAIALRRTKIEHHLVVVHDGQEALDFLKRTGEFANAPRPDVVWLDLQLPKKRGDEVLAEMKSDPELRSIPVVVISTSDDEKEIRRVYNLFGNCYVVKPIHYEKFEELVRSLCKHWLETVQLPACRAAGG